MVYEAMSPVRPLAHDLALNWPKHYDILRDIKKIALWELYGNCMEATGSDGQ